MNGCSAPALSHVGTLVEHAGDLDYDGQGEQVAHFEDHLRRSMMESFESLVAKLEKLNIPFGPLARPGDLFDDPQLNHDGRMLDTVLPTGKHAKIPGLPLEMDGRKTRIRLQPPRMGEHTRAVLAEAGYGAEEIERLVEQGVAIAG